MRLVSTATRSFRVQPLEDGHRCPRSVLFFVISFPTDGRKRLPRVGHSMPTEHRNKRTGGSRKPLERVRRVLTSRRRANRLIAVQSRVNTIVQRNPDDFSVRHRGTRTLGTAGVVRDLWDTRRYRFVTHARARARINND